MNMDGSTCCQQIHYLTDWRPVVVAVVSCKSEAEPSLQKTAAIERSSLGWLALSPAFLLRPRNWHIQKH